MVRKVWVYDPQSGGVPIRASEKPRIMRRIQEHANKHYAGKYNRIGVRFKGQFCYIDAYVGPEVPKNYDAKFYGETREEHIERMRNTPMHLCRLRHFTEERWSLAFYTYSNERYEPCFFRSGEWEGTPEEGFDIGATYLR